MPPPAKHNKSPARASPDKAKHVRDKVKHVRDKDSDQDKVNGLNAAAASAV